MDSCLDLRSTAFLGAEFPSPTPLATASAYTALRVKEYNQRYKQFTLGGDLNPSSVRQALIT
jgi:hypothetical protein